MDISARYSLPPVRLLRDRLGRTMGKLEKQRLTGKILARDARGSLVGSYESRKGTTRDALGIVVARGGTLAALLVHR